MIYLDNAATTLIKPAKVAETAADAINTLASPGRGGHEAAMASAAKLFECRESVSNLFNVKSPENVVFTFNATHALNIAIMSLIKPGTRVIVSGYEHNSVMRPLFAGKTKIRVINTPLFDRKKALEGFIREINRGADLVICTHISNVFGFIFPIKEISDICHAKKIPLIIDASQSAGIEEIDFSSLHAAFIAMPGHKGLYGPQGTGILLCGRTGKPLMYGGTGSVSSKKEMPDFLPDRLEAGTHNMPGIAGLKEGIGFIKKVGIAEIKTHERELIDLAQQRLTKIRGVNLFYTDNSDTQSGVLSFTMDNLSSEELAEKLGELNIAVRGGYHCSPMAHKTAGTAPKGTVRVSVSAFNTDNDIYALEDGVKYISTKH